MTGVNSTVQKYAKRAGRASKRVQNRLSAPSLGQSQAMSSVSGKLVSVWQRIIDNSPELQKQVTEISKSLNDLAGTLGESVVPAFRLLSDGIGSAVETFKSLPGPVRDFVGISFALISGLVMVTTAATTVSAAMSGVAAVLGGMLGPVLAVIAVTAALYAAWTNNFLGIKTKTKQVLKFVASAFKSFAKVALSVFLGINKALTRIWTTAFNLLVGVVRSYLKMVVKRVLRFAQYLAQLWTGVKQMLSGEWKKGLQTMLDATLSFVADTLKLWLNFGSRVVGAIGKLVARGVTEFQRLWDMLKAGGRSGANALVTVVESALNGVLGTVDQFLNKIEKTVNQAVEMANQVSDVSFDKVEFGSVGSVSLDPLEEGQSKQAIDQSAEKRYERRASRIDELTDSFVDGISERFLSPEVGEGSESETEDPSAVLPMLDDDLSEMFGSGPGDFESPMKGITAGGLLGGLGDIFGDSNSDGSESELPQSGQTPPNMGSGETPPPASGSGTTRKEVNEIHIDSIDVRTRARAPSTRRNTEQLAKDIGSEFSDQLGRRS